jgi:hypothetical protein
VLGQSPASRGGTTVRLLIRDDPDAYYVPSNVVAARLTNISASGTSLRLPLFPIYYVLSGCLCVLRCVCW